MKDTNVYHYMENNVETIDWSNLKFTNRLKVAFALIFIGKFRIAWKENRYFINGELIHELSSKNTNKNNSQLPKDKGVKGKDGGCSETGTSLLNSSAMPEQQKSHPADTSLKRGLTK